MYRILVVEDEIPMLQGLKDNLEIEGYSVDTASDGALGYEKIMTNTYDLIILDVMLPSISGFDICKKTRKEGNQTPIIILTAKGEELNKVLGLELGADDYITKPFSLRELLARIKAVLRRYSENKINDSPSVKTLTNIGRLTINFNTYQAFLQNKPLHMTHKEIELLSYLYKRKDKVVNRNELIENVWGIDANITTRTIDNFIVKLRQKIEDDPNNPQHIITVHGIGYKLILKD